MAQRQQAGSAANAPAGKRAAAPRTARRPKTAVVVIHGMGEQWPMETLRGFVQAVWTGDPEMVSGDFNRQVYSKPDRITDSYELRRITTRDWSGKRQRRVDFFEFYWAHQMQGNTLAAVTGWLKRLLLRPPSRVPERLMAGWIVGLVLLGLAALFSVLAAVKWAPEGDVAKVVWTLLGLAVPAVVTAWVIPVLGDAARYLSPAPGNIAARQEIREAGIRLLTKLHQSGDYDRIVLVGHSLGSVIGYDILHYAWGRLRADPDLRHASGSPAMAALEALEARARDLAQRAPPAGARAAYRRAQRAYFAELSKLRDAGGSPLWLVSDYVTLGCPLSKSDVLMAKDEADLKAKKALRDLPTAPPWLETDPKAPLRFSFPATATSRSPHHAAAFGPTVWTNVYFPNALGWMGDFISGPVASQLGPGVLDVESPIGGPRFRHNDYWRDPASRPPWIRALRRAVNLRVHDEDTLWGGQVDARVVWAEKLPDRIEPET